MASNQPVGPTRVRINSTLRQFLDNEASGGLVLLAVALLAILTANSPVADSYFAALHAVVKAGAM